MSEFRHKKNYPFAYFNYSSDPKTKIATVIMRNPNPRKGNRAFFRRRPVG